MLVFQGDVNAAATVGFLRRSSARTALHQAVHITVCTAPQPCRRTVGDLAAAIAVVAHHVLQPSAFFARPGHDRLGHDTNHPHQLATLVKTLELLSPTNEVPADEDTGEGENP